jgi:hypothetical protein
MSLNFYSEGWVIDEGLCYLVEQFVRRLLDSGLTVLELNTLHGLLEESTYFTFHLWAALVVLRPCHCRALV